MRSYSNLPESRIGRSMMQPPRGTTSHLDDNEAVFTFIAPASFLHSKTRAHVRLLGPCFKTGRMRPCDRQRPWRVSMRSAPERPAAVATHCTQSATVDNRPFQRDPSHKARTATPRSPSSHADPVYNSSLPRERTYLPEPFETRRQPTLARAREKCDGRRSEPDGRGPFRSAKTAHPKRGPAESRKAHC